MKVEVLCTLKGEKTWKRGTVFDDAVSPIPRDVMLEAFRGTNTVKILSKLKPELESDDVPPEINSDFSTTSTEDKFVEAQSDNESSITQENPSEHLPELEGLIRVKGTISATAKLLGVTPMSITRWRKGAMPKSNMLEKIKEEYKRLMRPNDDQDRINDIDSAGVKGPDIELE